MDEVAPDGPLASFRLDDRLIIVTGASEGIGRTFAEAFARAGAKLVLAVSYTHLTLPTNREV